MTQSTAAEVRQSLRTLDAAIAAGAKTVVIGDETIVYQDISEMLKARSMLINSLGSLDASSRGDRMSLAVFGDE